MATPLEGFSALMGRGALPELNWLERLSQSAPAGAAAQVLARVRVAGADLPIYAFSLGSDKPRAPVVGLVAGVHGLERIGTHIVCSYLDSLFVRLTWDRELRQVFRNMRLFAVPLLNPGGMVLGRRANPRGVDLMRNAPIDAVVPTPWLLGGHRLSPALPWYRGREEWGFELESGALVRYVEDQLAGAPLAQTLDVHSGFGVTDRIWHPWARSRELFPDAVHARRFQDLLDRSYPNHVYIVEPQSDSYTTHGDLWDYLYDRHRRSVRPRGGESVFIPWTLELGSWSWVRKNPRQLLRPHGAFNPLIPHRYERIMRRHMNLIDFLVRATRNHASWLDPG